jgi:hypothetical protein
MCCRHRLSLCLPKVQTVTIVNSNFQTVNNDKQLTITKSTLHTTSLFVHRKALVNNWLRNLLVSFVYGLSFYQRKILHTAACIYMVTIKMNKSNQFQLGYEKILLLLIDCISTVSNLCLVLSRDPWIVDVANTSSEHKTCIEFRANWFLRPDLISRSFRVCLGRCIPAAGSPMNTVKQEYFVGVSISYISYGLPTYEIKMYTKSCFVPKYANKATYVRKSGRTSRK